MALFNNVNKTTRFLKQVFKSKQILTQFATESSTNGFLYAQKDPAPLFFNTKIQNHLKILTRIDYNKVYRKRKNEEKVLETPSYKFVTTKQLQKLMEEVKQKAEEKLQMPPVVKVREPINEIISKDPALKGLDTAQFVFTDITFGLEDRDRLIITRDPDGTLKKSDWDVRHRMNQLYFPKPGCHLTIPRMFQSDYLLDLLHRKEYEFVLDAACAQFEPDDELYQNVTSTTYQHVNKERDFDVLRSTRHFGPMVFFLAWTKNIDEILLDLLETKHIAEAEHLLHLYYKLNDQTVDGREFSDLLQMYISTSPKRSTLELAAQALNSEENRSKQVVS